MHRYQIGIILEPWIDIEPPISAEPLKESSKPEYELSPEGDIQSNMTKKEQTTTIPLSGDMKGQGTPSTFADLAEQEEREDVERAIRDYPSLDTETQRGITLKFRELHAKVQQQSLYDCNYSGYGFDICRYLLFFGLFYFAFNNGYYLPAAVFLGCFWQQIMFVAHDAGHLAITHNVVFDTILGVAVADLCCGLSLGWWKSSHNVHHLVPNHPVSNISQYFTKKKV